MEGRYLNVETAWLGWARATWPSRGTLRCVGTPTWWVGGLGFRGLRRCRPHPQAPRSIGERAAAEGEGLGPWSSERAQGLWIYAPGPRWSEGRVWMRFSTGGTAALTPLEGGPSTESAPGPWASGPVTSSLACFCGHPASVHSRGAEPAHFLHGCPAGWASGRERLGAESADLRRELINE